jgi:integrase
MRSTFSIIFYINRQKEKRNGKCPVMGRITIDGKVSQFSTGEEIIPSLWPVKTGRSAGKGRADRELSQKLQQYRRELASHYARLVEDNACVTAESLKKAFMDSRGNRHDETQMLLAGFKAHNREYLKSVGVTVTKGSYGIYSESCKALEKFIAQRYGLEDIAFRELQYSFIEDFGFFLRVNLNFSPATVFNIIMKLKRIVHQAVNRKAIKKDPFAGFSCNPGDTTRKWLSKEQLDRVMSAPVADPKVEQARLLFIFSAFTGLAFTDLHNLRQKDITIDGEGTAWIRIKRKKTGTQAVVPLLDIPKRIYDRYGIESKDKNKHKNPEDKVFDVPSYPLIRSYLKEIGRATGIKPLKFHQRRHSNFCFRLKNNELQELFS